MTPLDQDAARRVFAHFVTAFNAWPDSLGELRLHAVAADMQAVAEVPKAGLMRSYFQWIDLSDRPMIGSDFMLTLYGPEDLPRAQQGWQSTRDEDPAWGWKPGFTVFADRNGDVLVYDRLDEHSAIFGSIQKRSFKVAASILALIAGLQAGIAVQLLEFDGETVDEQENPAPAFLARVREAISEVGGVDVDGFMKFFFE